MAVKSPLKPDRVETHALITGEELFQMGNIGRTELVEGEIVAMSPTGYLHGRIENRFGVVLDTFVRQNKFGVVFVGEVGIYTKRNPDTVRGADVVFVSHQRLAQVKSKSYLDVTPELIVEIMSPNDSWSEVMHKLEEYFTIGVSAVWVVDPEQEQVYVYHALTEVERFTANDLLPGGEALPDFGVSVAELFATDISD